ncbi:hypothetical protein [Nocardia australiensis]|uniref:hypothetical protein n=1 Tax=Nocardia australiensis TaxID=2887191 RepID=UPI001D14A7F2|nr:hypothetical protein [Nocardia australiensis]
MSTARYERAARRRRLRNWVVGARIVIVVVASALLVTFAILFSVVGPRDKVRPAQPTTTPVTTPPATAPATIEPPRPE